jgi:D-inositol-3-phosphate glycosyltransferase
MTEKLKMLYVGDFPIQTGFGVVSTNLIKYFREKYEVHVLGVNYHGDYDPLCEGLKVYPAAAAGDIWGFSRLNELITRIQPDVVFVLNDPWICMQYAEQFEQIRDKVSSKFVAYTPVDAENVKKEFVEGLSKYDAVVTYTQFGLEQILKTADIIKKLYIVPHGVDTETFRPVSREEVRKKMKMDEDVYCVLCLQRNQPRKRIDMTMYYFAEWVKRYNLPKSVKFYYHGSLHDFGIDIIQWAEYLGIADRLAISSPHIRPDKGLPAEQINWIYNAADVFFTTTMAEGWCLPVAEAMAAGLPVIIPRHSALAEWPEDNCEYAEVYPVPFLTDRGLNTVHHITEMESAIAALHRLYTDRNRRTHLGNLGYLHMRKDKFNWKNIANQFMEIVDGISE